MSRKKQELKQRFEQMAKRYASQWWGNLFADAVKAIEGFENDTLEAAATLAENAQLPAGYQWGDDAMQQFSFGKERAAQAIRDMKKKEET